MTTRLNQLLPALAIGAALTAPGAASAQSAGAWMIKVGINQIKPDVDSGDVSAPALPHTQADVGIDTEPILNLAYMIKDNISAELALGLPYKHDILGAGRIAGTGKLGSAEVLPPTAFIQYRFFNPQARLRPYVGLGLTYAYFQKETGSGQLTAVIDAGGPAATFSIDNKFAASFQIGATVAIDQRWYADAALVKTRLKTRVHYSPGQTQDIRLDPLAISFGIGYRF